MNGNCLKAFVFGIKLQWHNIQKLLPGRCISRIYLPNIVALVTTLQQTSNKIPKEAEVLLRQGFFQLLYIQNKEIGSNIAIIKWLKLRLRTYSKRNK